jgi:hypothetical protein
MIDVRPKFAVAGGVLSHGVSKMSSWWVGGWVEYLEERGRASACCRWLGGSVWKRWRWTCGDAPRPRFGAVSGGP